MLLNIKTLIRVAVQLVSLATSSSISEASSAELQNLEARAPATSTYSGGLVNKAQLDFIKFKVNSGAQPWTNAYNAMLFSSLGSTSRKPSPVATVRRMYGGASRCYSHTGSSPRDFGLSERCNLLRQGDDQVHGPCPSLHIPKFRRLLPKASTRQWSLGLFWHRQLLARPYFLS